MVGKGSKPVQLQERCSDMFGFFPTDAFAQSPHEHELPFDFRQGILSLLLNVSRYRARIGIGIGIGMGMSIIRGVIPWIVVVGVDECRSVRKGWFGGGGQ